MYKVLFSVFLFHKPATFCIHIILSLILFSIKKVKALGQNYLFKKYIIYLAPPCLSCGTQDLRCCIRFHFRCGIWALSCVMQDLVPSLGIKPEPFALGPQNLSHWTAREIASPFFFF